MSVVLFGVVVALAAAAAMEPWARLLHRHAWHRSLWPIHRSHHEPRTTRFEANDWLSVLHAPVAAALIVGGCQTGGFVRAALVGAGAGMTAFGALYLAVHDGFIHGRLGLAWLARFRYFRRVRGAHLTHHRAGALPFGLFLGPRELRPATVRRSRAAIVATKAPGSHARAAMPSAGGRPPRAGRSSRSLAPGSRVRYRRR